MFQKGSSFDLSTLDYQMLHRVPVVISMASPNIELKCEIIEWC